MEAERKGIMYVDDWMSPFFDCLDNAKLVYRRPQHTIDVTNYTAAGLQSLWNRLIRVYTLRSDTR